MTSDNQYRAINLLHKSKQMLGLLYILSEETEKNDFLSIKDSLFINFIDSLQFNNINNMLIVKKIEYNIQKINCLTNVEEIQKKKKKKKKRKKRKTNFSET